MRMHTTVWNTHKDEPIKSNAEVGLRRLAGSVLLQAPAGSLLPPRSGGV